MLTVRIPHCHTTTRGIARNDDFFERAIDLFEQTGLLNVLFLIVDQVCGLTIYLVRAEIEDKIDFKVLPGDRAAFILFGDRHDADVHVITAHYAVRDRKNNTCSVC